MAKRTPKTQTKQQPLPLRLNSRVRVTSVVIRAGYSSSLRYSLLERLDGVGTVVSFDPRSAWPFCIKLDDGTFICLAEDNLEVLEP